MRYIFLIFFTCFSFLVDAQHWQEAYNKASAAYETGSYEEALSLSKEALSVAHQRHGEISNEAINTLQLLINICEDADEVIKYSETLVATIEKAVGKENEYFVQAAKNHQTLLINSERYKDANKFSEITSTVFRSFLGNSNSVYGQFCSDLAYSYVQTQEFDKAIINYTYSTDAFKLFPEFKDHYINDLISLNQLLIQEKDNLQVIRIGREINSLKVDNNISISNNVHIGNAYFDLKKYDSASYFYARAKETIESNHLEKNNLYTHSLNQLAVINDLSGNVVDSEVLLSEAVSGKDKTTIFNQAITAQNNSKTETAQKYYNELFELEKAGNLTEEEIVRLYDNYSLFNLRSAEFDQALDYNNRAVDLGKKLYGKKSQSYYKLLYRQGLILNNAGKSADCNKLFQELVKDLESSDFTKSSLYVDVMSYYALLEQTANNFSHALKLFNKAVEVASGIEMRKDDRASLYNNYSVILQLNGRYSVAEDFQLKSLSLTEESLGKGSSNYANGLLNLGELYVKKGEFSRADSSFTIAKNLQEQIYGISSPEYALALISTTKLFKEQGRYVEADKSYIMAMDLLKMAGDSYLIDYAFAMNDYGLLLQILGNYKLAERYFLNAAEIFKQSFGQLNTDYASSLSNLATLYQIQDNHSKAEGILLSILDIDKQLYGENHPKYATTLHNLASILQTQKKYNKAIEYYTEALQIDSITYGVNHYSYANTLYNLADIYDVQARYDEAFITYQKVLNIMRENYGIDNPEFTYRLFGLARLYQRQNKYNEALDLYDQIIEQYMFQIKEYFPALSEDQKALFYAKVEPIFASYRELLINGKETGAAHRLFDLQLKTKALLLNASNKLKQEINQSADPVVKKLYNDLTIKKSDILNYYNLSLGELKSKGVDLQSMELEIDHIEKQLSQRVQLFSEVFEEDEYSWKDVQKKLQPNEVVVEIVRVEESLKNDKITYVATVLSSSEEPKLVILPDGESLEDRIFKMYRNSIKYDFSDTVSYAYYWKEINEFTKGYDVVYICPDGIYNKINVNTLYSSEDQKYVIDNHKIKYLSSTKEILKGKAEKPAGTTATMFGFPKFKTEDVALSASTGDNLMYEEWMTNIEELPGTEVEVSTILNELHTNQWEASGYISNDAMESTLKNVNNPRVLHIATHGFFSKDISYDVNDWKEKEKTEDFDFNPLLRSGLLLTSAESSVRKRINGLAVDAENDGILTAYEAMNLNLDNTDLVVLSACETGLGEIKNGEGVYGLQRAFLVSGAKNIIISLWKVDDKVTQELMQEFYSLWLKSGDLHQSFRGAQLAMKKKYVNPHLWGGFIINGK